MTDKAHVIAKWEALTREQQEAICHTGQDFQPSLSWEQTEDLWDAFVLSIYPAAYTLQTATTLSEEGPPRAGSLAEQLWFIRKNIEGWVRFDTESRAREGLSSDDSTMLISPPCWPDHGQLNNWSAVLKQAEAALSGKEPTS